MSRGGRQLAGVAAWLLLVVACSTGVWTVIRSAGAQVTGPTAVPAPAMTTSAARPLPSPRARADTRRPRKTRTPSPSPSPAVRSTPPPAAPTAAPAPPPSRTSVPTRERTWSGRQGTVVVACRGAVIALRGAQPDAGWRVEVGDRGPEQVEVQFARGDDSGEVQVQAHCAGGSPVFRVESDT